MFETTFQALTDHAPDPIVVFDAAWRVIYANRSTNTSFGWRATDLPGKRLEQLCADLAPIAELQMAVEGGEQGVWLLNLRHRDGSTSTNVARATMLRDESRTRGFVLYLRRPEGAVEVALLHQVTALQSSLHDYREMALTDALTGVPNRRALEESLARECARAARQGTPVSVVMMDLDGFKQINDQHGHVAGDEALRRYARLLHRLSRASDVLGRLGGDEFLLILAASAVEARHQAERLQSAVGQQILEPEWPRCSMSVGIASSEPAGAGEAQSLVERADAALYVAKRSGQNTVQVALLQKPACLPRRVG